jgi:hypothetical protein
MDREKAIKLDVLLQLGLDYKLAEHLVKHNTIDELNELIRLELEAQCRRKGKFCDGKAPARNRIH